MPAHSLDDILDLLDRYHQRATYGAVGAVVDRPPYFLMAGRPCDARHSWIVSAKTHLPTGYGEQHMHARLCERSEVLRTFQELSTWIRDPS